MSSQCFEVSAAAAFAPEPDRYNESISATPRFMRYILTFIIRSEITKVTSPAGIDDDLG